MPKRKRITYFAAVLFVTVCVLEIIMAAPITAASDTETPYKVFTHWITQPVDHERPFGQKFKQEVMILIPEKARSNSPVFFNLGGEGDCTEAGLIGLYEDYGEPENIIFVRAEHRGYGQSLTNDEDQSVPAYITIDQALADYHKVARIFKWLFHGPWMAAGYSYSGGLVVNFARNYPNDAKVILVSSGVIDWPFLMDEYDRQMRINLGENLYSRLAYHMSKLTPAEIFDETWQEREFLHWMSLGLTQYAEYQSFMPLIGLLSYLPTKAFMRTLHFLDRVVLDGWVESIVWSMVVPKLTREEALDGTYNWRMWKYQQCTQTGTFWISYGPGGLFTRSEEEICEECRATFDIDPALAPWPRWNPRSMIDELSIPQVYVVGGNDPWKDLCLKQGQKPLNSTYFFVPEGLHCPDRSDTELGKKVLAEMLEFAGE